MVNDQSKVWERGSCKICVPSSFKQIGKDKKSILFNSDFSIGQDCAQCKSQVDDHYKEEWSVEKSPTRQFEEGRRAN